MKTKGEKIEEKAHFHRLRKKPINTSHLSMIAQNAVNWPQVVGEEKDTQQVDSCRLGDWSQKGEE